MCPPNKPFSAHVYQHTSFCCTCSRLDVARAMARQKRLARPYSLFACPHGREGVPCDAVKNSQLLTTLLQHHDSGYSLAPEMPRQLLRVWAQASVVAQSKPLCRLKDAEWDLTDVIKVWALCLPLLMLGPYTTNFQQLAFACQRDVITF